MKKQKSKRNTTFLLGFIFGFSLGLHYSDLMVECTHVRKNEKNFGFLLT